MRLGRKLLGFVDEKKVAACTGAGANFRKVRSIAVYVEMLFFAGNKPYGGIWMGGTVVKEMGDGLGCGSCSFGLGHRESTKSNKKCAVDGASVKQEGPDDSLDAGETASVEWVGVVSRWGELDFGAISGGSPGVRSMLGTRWTFGKEGVEGFLDVPGHGEVDGAGDIVPFESDAAIH